MAIIEATDSALLKAAELLRAGELVAFPTETVYGLGADALNAKAVAKVFQVKQRPAFDPLIVHLASVEQAQSLIAQDDPRLRDLAKAFWPGPLTVVLPKNERVPDIVTAGLDTVALRVPDHAVAQKLLQFADTPIAAPSANLFSRVSPTRAEHVWEQLADQVPCILDGGPCRVGIESTVVSLAEAQPVILRPGMIEPRQLEAILGPVTIQPGSDRPQAPGQLSRHYATRTPLKLVDSPDEVTVAEGEQVGFMSLLPPQNPQRFAAVVALSPSGDLLEAASRLFASLRTLDAMQLDRLVVQRIPEEGLGLAIMDRLKRSAHKSDS